MDPEAHTLGDSALVHDLVVASGSVSYVLGAMRPLMTRMMNAIPDGAEEAAEVGMTVEQYADSLIATMEPDFMTQMVTASRYAYRDVSPEALSRATAFYRSPAGAYVIAKTNEGNRAAMEPMIVQLVEAMAKLSTMFDGLPDAVCEADPDACEASGDEDQDD